MQHKISTLLTFFQIIIFMSISKGTSGQENPIPMFTCYDKHTTIELYLTKIDEFPNFQKVAQIDRIAPNTSAKIIITHNGQKLIYDHNIFVNSDGAGNYIWEVFAYPDSLLKGLKKIASFYIDHEMLDRPEGFFSFPIFEKPEFISGYLLIGFEQQIHLADSIRCIFN